MSSLYLKSTHVVNKLKTRILYIANVTVSTYADSGFMFMIAVINMYTYMGNI